MTASTVRVQPNTEFKLVKMKRTTSWFSKNTKNHFLVWLNEEANNVQEMRAKLSWGTGGTYYIFIQLLMALFIKFFFSILGVWFAVESF